MFFDKKYQIRTFQGGIIIIEKVFCLWPSRQKG